MRVLSLIQDPRGKGGARTASSWYERWMERNRPGEAEPVYIDDSAPAGDYLRRARSWRPGDGAVPRLLPRLHAPQFLGARRVVARAIDDATEAHAIGGVALQGVLAPDDCSLLAWFGTTIGDERRSAIGHRDLVRKVLHTMTLPALESIERRVFARAERLMPQSPHTADLLVREGIPARRIEVQAVPIDTERFRPGDDERRGALFVGRALDPRKNFDATVRALGISAGLRDRGLDVVSPEPALPSRFAAYAEHIRWRGEVDDVAALFRSAEVFVLTSRQEGLGIVVFEALASGTPVVATRCGGPDRWLAESGGGYVVDEAGVGPAVERVLGDATLRQELGAAGRAWVEANMSAAAFLDDTSIFRV
jgi:glycosyltransferase involved in cell wall biosynthesis